MKQALELLRAAVQGSCSWALKALSESLLPVMAEQLSSEQVVRLITAAVEQGSDERCIEELCKLLAAAGISSKAALQLLRAALEGGRDCKQLLKLLPAASSDSEAVLPLLQAAVGKGSCSNTAALCAAPAVAKLSSTAVVALLGAAAKRGCC